MALQLVTTRGTRDGFARTCFRIGKGIAPRMAIPLLAAAFLLAARPAQALMARRSLNQLVNGSSLIAVGTVTGLRNEVVGQSAKTWDMAVTLPGQQRKEFAGLPNANEKFEQLTWLGFMSNATTQTVFYLDNLALTNEA